LTLLKAHNTSVTESKDAEILDEEFKSLPLKMINDFKEDSNKHMDEMKKLIQDVNKKIRTWIRNSARKLRL
jgi:hypothetical protein